MRRAVWPELSVTTALGVERGMDSQREHDRIYRATLQAIFAPKFTHLVPPELVARIIEFSFHVGFY